MITDNGICHGIDTSGYWGTRANTGLLRAINNRVGVVTGRLHTAGRNT